jgi:hypothetical protein
MSTRVEAASSMPDTLKWIFSGAFLVAGLAGFYYFGEHSTLLRVVGLLLAVGAAIAVAVRTDKGREAWAFMYDSSHRGAPRVAGHRTAATVARHCGAPRVAAHRTATVAAASAGTSARRRRPGTVTSPDFVVGSTPRIAAPGRHQVADERHPHHPGDRFQPFASASTEPGYGRGDGDATPSGHGTTELVKARDLGRHQAARRSTPGVCSARGLE